MHHPQSKERAARCVGVRLYGSFVLRAVCNIWRHLSNCCSHPAVYIIMRALAPSLLLRLMQRERDKGVHYLNTSPARSALESQQKFNLVQPIIQKCRTREERKRCGASKLNSTEVALVNKMLHNVYFKWLVSLFIYSNARSLLIYIA